MPETGDPIRLQAIDLRIDDTHARFLTYGLTLTRFAVEGQNYVLSLPDDVYLREHPYVGAIIGPVANRIARGRFVIDGKICRAATNEGENTNHSGPEGFDRQVWEVVETSETHAVFLHTMPDGHQGYPGPLTVTVTARLSRESLTLTYKATTVRPTPVSLTHHVYARLPDTDTVDDIALAVAAPTVTRTDSEKLPTDYAHALEAGDDLDSRDPRRIGGTSIDNSYNLGSDLHDDDMREAVAMQANGTKLVVSTDLPAVQIYTGEALDRPRSGLAIEPQYPPDLVSTDRAEDVILRPGEIYRYTIHYRVAPADPLA